MHLERYPIEASGSFTSFEFDSEGPKGIIRKRIEFKLFENSQRVYNLSFGDETRSGRINDKAISNNGDSRKVLFTVGAAVYKFLEKHKSCFVYVVGNTKARTRLYRMGITNNLGLVTQDFEIFGLTQNGWEVFSKDKEYNAFLVKRKYTNFIIR